MVASRSHSDLLTSLLRDVSRSFYLTMRVLPGAIRPQISLAYLLARATDTIADTEIVPVTERLAALEMLRRRILGDAGARLDLARFVAVPGAGAATSTPAERLLLQRIEEALTVLAGFEPADQQRIRDVLTTITSGQALDLQRFHPPGSAPGDGSRRVIALANETELDDYTYRVAGCVGEFWTKTCRARLFPRAAIDDPALLAEGIRFGKGLQLVNILRDVPADLRRGSCYLPADELAALGLAPADLLVPAAEPRLRPLYDRYLDRAQAHLAAGWAYTNRLPRRQVRVRLACAWPVLIGVKTLARLRTGNVLDPARRIKISRAEIGQILRRSVLAYAWPRAWRGLFGAMSK